MGQNWFYTQMERTKNQCHKDEDKIKQLETKLNDLKISLLNVDNWEECGRLTERDINRVVDDTVVIANIMKAIAEDVSKKLK